MIKNIKIHFFAAGLLFLLCLITYGDVLTHRFMLDERVYLDPSSNIYTYYHNLGDFFRKPFDQHYIPLNFLMNVGLFRLFHSPFPFYLINLFLFYANCGLLFLFVYSITNDFIPALLASSLFCIHPMTGDMLQHITFNIIFLQTIFMESGLIALYLYAKENRSIFYYFFSLLMVILALFSQETAIFFPLYAAAVLFFLTDLKFGRIVRLVLPFVFLSVLLVVIWLSLVNPNQHLENIKILHPGFFWYSWANFSRLFFWYISNLFVPRDIVFMCTLAPLNNCIWLWGLLLFGFLAGCARLILFYLGKSLEGFALVFFLTGFIFSFLASQARLRYWAAVFEPNWVYFSSIGYYLFLVLVLLKLKKHIKGFLFTALVSVLFISYFICTIGLDMTSRTEIGYAENWLRKFPHNAMAVNIVASFYYNHKDLEIPSDLIPDLLDLLDVYIKENVPATAGLIERISSCKLTPEQREELSLKWTAYLARQKHAATNPNPSGSSELSSH